jgi:hypothetical protein
MSQATAAIANMSRTLFRAAVNAIAQAIQSMNSGATEPTETYAYMPWADTTSGWLKQRNAADSAWIKRWPLGTGASVDVASATTLDLDAAAANSATLRITGTTATTGITLADGQQRLLRAAAAWPITHSASLICPGGVSYTCAAGDLILAIGEAAGVVRLAIWKADGTAVVSSTSAKVNDFRLTLTTAAPVTTADVTAAGTIYCTPYKGNQISLYSGSAWVTRSSAEFSLALSALTSGKPYDVFCYDNAGTPTLEFLVWTNDTTRATALAYQDGVLVKSGAATRRYLGTFYTTATTTTEDSKANRYLWNYYNRVRRQGKVTDATLNWTYTSGTVRQVRASTANQFNFVVGVAEDSINFVMHALYVSSTNNAGFGGIGLDTTTTIHTDCGYSWVQPASGQIVPMTANLDTTPSAGRHYAAWLESGNTNGQFYGTDTNKQPGLMGSMFA